MTARAWGVWTAWRGEPRLFVHLVRTAMRAVSTDGSAGGCVIVAELDGDRECFEGPEEWLATVTHKAMNRFEMLSVRTVGPAGALSIVFAYMRAPGRSRTPSIVVNARAADDQAARDLIAAVGPALRRGGFGFARPPATGTGTDGRDDAVARLVRRRYQQTEGLYLSVVALVLAGTLLTPAPSESSPVGTALGVVIAVVAVVTVLVLSVAAASLVVGLEQRPRLARWRRQAHRVIFPAIDIAPRQPGRRSLGLLVGAIGPLAAPVAKYVVGL